MNLSNKARWVIFIGFIVLAVAVINNRESASPSYSYQAPPTQSITTGSAQIAGPQDFPTQVKQLQQSSSNQYIPVTVPGSSDFVNLYFKSRLYRDRLELFADMNDPRRGSQWWVEQEAIGSIKSDGSGGSYYFTYGDPCSELKSKIEDTPTMHSEVTGQLCLKQNSIEVHVKLLAESRGTGTQQMKQAGACIMLPNGNCDFLKTPQDHFSSFVVLPR
jgi:hypothetical protein